METEARGQLGGVETSDDVRRRLAEESGAWKCVSCAKTNADIMKDCEERCHDSESKSADVAIPKELTMVWKDELNPTATAEKAAASAKHEDSAELAEGFIQTVPQPLPATDGQASNSTQTTQNTARPPVTHDSSQTHLQRAPVATQSRSSTDEAVPLWIDRAIVVLVVLLIALLVKVLFGL